MASKDGSSLSDRFFQGREFDYGCWFAVAFHEAKLRQFAPAWWETAGSGRFDSMPETSLFTNSTKYGVALVEARDSSGII